MQPWRDEYLVHSYEADSSGRLSPGGLLRYLQESAWNHARSLGWGLDPRESGPLVWVLARLRLRAARYPGWDERVSVETWPVGIDRMLALRDFRVLDRGGIEIAAATSGWLVIEAAGRRPRRPEQALPGLVEVPALEPIAGIPGRIQALPAEAEATRRRVVHSDIDVNGHVNNVRYLEWVIDSHYERGRRPGSLGFFEAAYLSEALMGEEVEIRSAVEGPESLHSIVAARGGRDLCRVRLRWNP